MIKRICFRNMDKSEGVEQYANEHLKKIEHFLENERTPVYIDLILEPSKTREHHRVELRVKSPNYDLISEYEHTGDAFYKTLDRVIDTMYKLLQEAKAQKVETRKENEPTSQHKKL